MKIGLLLPSLLAAKRYEERIFAPKDLVVALADGLVEKGHDVYVFSSADLTTRAKLVPGDRTLEAANLLSIKIHYHQKEYIKELVYKLAYNEYETELTMKAFLKAKKEGFDILHSYHDFAAHYFAQLVPEIPCVYTLHDPIYSFRTLEGWRLDRFPQDRYIAISHHQADNFRDRINITGVVYHGIDIKEYQFLEESEGYWAFMGRFIPEKGAKEAIEIAKKLKIPLKIATSPNYLNTPYYKETIEPILADPYAEMMGFLSGKTRNTWLAKAKALLFPIFWEEPFGMALIETMATGTPVVAFARGSLSEIVVDGETGFLVNPDGDKRGDFIVKKSGIEGLTEAVRRINDLSVADYKKMRRACRKRVEEKFTTQKMIEGYERVYEKALRNRKQEMGSSD